MAAVASACRRAALRLLRLQITHAEPDRRRAKLSQSGAYSTAVLQPLDKCGGRRRLPATRSHLQSKPVGPPSGAAHQHSHKETGSQDHGRDTPAAGCADSNWHAEPQRAQGNLVSLALALDDLFGSLVPGWCRGGHQSVHNGGSRLWARVSRQKKSVALDEHVPSRGLSRSLWLAFRDMSSRPPPCHCPPLPLSCPRTAVDPLVLVGLAWIVTSTRPNINLPPIHPALLGKHPCLASFPTYHCMFPSTPHASPFIWHHATDLLLTPARPSV